MIRRPVRWLVRVAVMLCILSLFVFLSDLKYDFLPSAIQKNLKFHPNDPIIADIQIKQCGMWRKCERLTSSGLVRIDKDLHLGRSRLSSAYVYVARVNETDIAAGQKVVLNLAVGKYDPTDMQAELPSVVQQDLASKVSSEKELTDPEMALTVASNNGWKLEDAELGLWVKRGPHVPKGAVSSINVVYGSLVEYPVEDWFLTDALPIGPAAKSPEALQEFGPRLLFKIGRTELNTAPHRIANMGTLRFNKDGVFRIAQLADLHMSTGFGVCDKPAHDRDTCVADLETRTLVNTVLDTESVDLVVFSGDQIFGDSSPDPETALLKAVAPVLKRGIPFTMVWGNHDDQGPYDRQRLMDFVLTLPNAYIDLESRDQASGVGNYVVSVRSYNSDHPALTLYFLDSHANLPHKSRGYDYIHSDQQQWLRHEYEKVREARKGFGHAAQSMAFFHIPLPEYNEGTADMKVGGLHREAVISPSYNSGTLDVLRDIGVSVVSVGHDHANDFCSFQYGKRDNQKPIWLCYGGGTGFGGYGGYPDADGHPYERRIRLFEFDEKLVTTDTWHRVERMDEYQNEVELVVNGKASFPFELGDDE